jgi:hypothetical protein
LLLVRLREWENAAAVYTEQKMSDETRELKPAELAELLRATGKSIVTEISTLPADVARWHPAPGEWCALEVLGHFIEAERRGFANRVRDVLQKDGVRFETWDPPAVAAARKDHDRSTTELLFEFRDLRRDSAALVERLRPEDLQRGGDHPGIGRLTIRDLIHEWVHHDREHYKQLLTVVQGALWPSMGNCQKFSE